MGFAGLFVCLGSSVDVQSVTHRCLLISSDRAERKQGDDKTALICTDVDSPGGDIFFSFFFSNTRFIDFPTEGNRGTRGHTPLPPQIFAPFRGNMTNAAT